MENDHEIPQAEPTPEPEPPAMEKHTVTCGTCQTQYGFECTPDTDSFTFVCPKDNVQTIWTRG